MKMSGNFPLKKICFIRLLNTAKNRNEVNFVTLVTFDKNGEISASQQRICNLNTNFELSINFFYYGLSTIKCKLLGDGHLTILCEISDSIKRLKKFENNQHLSDNFKVMLQNKEYSDVTIVVEEKEFYVHKAILALHSSVFSAMFKHDMKKNQQKIVAVSDIDYKTMESLLEYIYTGRIKNIDDLTDQLLIAAEKYAIEKLKMACSHALIEQINLENVCEMGKLADTYQANDLKASVLDYISSHHKEVMEIAEYKTVPDLLFLALKNVKLNN